MTGVQGRFRGMALTGHDSGMKGAPWGREFVMRREIQSGRVVKASVTWFEGSHICLFIIIIPVLRVHRLYHVKRGIV